MAGKVRYAKNIKLAFSRPNKISSAPIGKIDPYTSRTSNSGSRVSQLMSSNLTRVNKRTSIRSRGR